MSKVVIVNGTIGTLDLLGDLLCKHAEIYVEDNVGAYAKIMNLRPDLVVLFLETDYPLGFQILTALKLNPATKDIPVMTCMPEVDDDEDGQEISPPIYEEDFFIPKPDTMSTN